MSYLVTDNYSCYNNFIPIYYPESFNASKHAGYILNMYNSSAFTARNCAFPVGNSVTSC